MPESVEESKQTKGTKETTCERIPSGKIFELNLSILTVTEDSAGTQFKAHLTDFLQMAWVDSRKHKLITISMF